MWVFIQNNGLRTDLVTINKVTKSVLNENHPYISVHFATYALCLLVVCIGGLWKAVGWVVLGVQCMLMCMGSELCCGWLQCSCYPEHGRYGLS